MRGGEAGPVRLPLLLASHTPGPRLPRPEEPAGNQALGGNRAAQQAAPLADGRPPDLHTCTLQEAV